MIHQVAPLAHFSGSDASGWGIDKGGPSEEWTPVREGAVKWTPRPDPDERRAAHVTPAELSHRISVHPRLPLR